MITPTLAVINHCAELEHCAPIRIKERFKFETAKTPVDQDRLDTFLMHARPVIKALVLVMFATACQDSRRERRLG